MLHLRPHRCLALLGRRLGAVPIEQATLARLHRHLPGDAATPVLRALVHTLVARVAPCLRLVTMQQHARLRHVRRVGGRRRQAVRQTRFGVHPDMRLHPEVPLVSLLRLVHLRIPFSPAVLRRRRRVNDARIHDRRMPERRQMHIDLLEQPHALRLQAEVQDRRLVRQRTAQAQTRKAAHRLHLVEHLHGRTRSITPSG